MAVEMEVGTIWLGRKVLFTYMFLGFIYACTRMGEGTSEARGSRHCYSTFWQQGRFEWLPSSRSWCNYYSFLFSLLLRPWFSLFIIFIIYVINTSWFWALYHVQWVPSNLLFLYVYFSLEGVQSILIACLFVCQHVLKTAWPNFTKFSFCLNFGHGSAILWLHCNMLSTSCFVGGVMLSHHGPFCPSCIFLSNERIAWQPKLLHRFQPVLVKDKKPASTHCWWHGGAKSAVYNCLVLLYRKLGHMPKKTGCCS